MRQVLKPRRPVQGVALALVLAAVCASASASSAGALPAGRGYELVSAADKNGGDVLIDTARVRVAVDGSAVEYSSLVGFGDTVGGGVATEYMAVRGADAWSTHAISPPQQALTFTAITAGLEPRYEGDLSPDLTKGVVRPWRPLTEEDSNVANVSNLYLRDDLRTPGAAGYKLVTACPLCVVAFPSSDLTHRPTFIDATADYDKILFESELNLALGARGGNFKLYLWDHGVVELAGILPDGTPALKSGAGNANVSGTGYTHRSISTDGRKIFFTAPVRGVDNVYMRLDGTSTVQLNASETAPSAAADAQYADASVSGSRVFFVSRQPLTDDAPRDSSAKLYLYDTTKPDSDPHNLTYLNVDSEPADGGSSVGGVVGASADGSTVYFFDAGQLVAGAPLPGIGAPLFVWHDGELSYIHELAIGDQTKITFNQSSPALDSKHSMVSESGDLIYRSQEPVGPAGQNHGTCSLNFSNACYEVYVYTLATHQLRCASCSPNGAPAAGDAVLMLQGPSVGGSSRPAHLNRTISEDGRRVFFTTPSALVPEDVNGKNDAYMYDVPSGTVSLLSSGRDSSDSYFMESSPSGDDAVFMTRERLVGWDHDNSYDIYDARVGGGFPEPPPTQPGCTGDACKGSPAVTPAAEIGASSIFAGTGDARAKLAHRHESRRCPRGTVRRRIEGRDHKRHVKCVKRKARQAGHAHGGRTR